MPAGSDAFTRTTLPGEYPDLAREQALHAGTKSAPEHVEETPPASTRARPTEPIAMGPQAAPNPGPPSSGLISAVFAPTAGVLPFTPAAPPSTTRPAIPRALARPEIAPFSEARAPSDSAPASTSLSPFAIRTSAASASHAIPAPAPRRAPWLMVVGAAIAIGCVAAFIGRELRRTTDTSTRETAAPPAVVVVSSPVAALPARQPSTPASVATTSEPKPQPVATQAPITKAQEAAPGPAPTANAGAARAPVAPLPIPSVLPIEAPRKSTPKATNRPFEVED